MPPLFSQLALAKNTKIREIGLWNILGKKSYTDPKKIIGICCAMTHIGLVLISGFMTRWGVHHYVVDPIGHCITPVPYHFDRETARLILEEVNYTNIRAFLEDFTAVKNHRVGSDDSQNFAKNISDLWKDFGLDRVEINEIINKSK